MPQACICSSPLLNLSLPAYPCTQVCDLETYVTDMQWFPGANKNAAGNDVYVVSCTDGSFKICQRNGRVEKSVDAHRGGT